MFTCLVLLGMGPCLYWLFGVNRIRTHAKKMNRLGYWRHGSKISYDEKRYLVTERDPFYSNEYRGLLNVSERVVGKPLLQGNKIEILHNGEEAYTCMLDAIAKAKKFIYLSTYIFDSDETGMKFVRALSEAKGRDVRIWVLVDSFGEYYSPKPISRYLKMNGIEVGRFLPISPSLNSLHFNLRNHRKLLIADGDIGFTGGMNIRGSNYETPKGNGKGMTDLHFKIEGPVISEFQKVFMEDWYFTRKESLPWDAPIFEPFPGRSVCRAVSGGPNEDFEKINWILMGALAWAQKRIQIMTPYFLPDRVMVAALNMASLRGVQVEVILPLVNNLPFVGWANRAILGEMLEHGIKFYYQPAPFSHSKTFVVDGSYALVGSSNWDARSLRLNFELDLEIYDPITARELSKHFDGIKSRSKGITFEEVNSDPLPVKLRNSFANLFAPYL